MPKYTIFTLASDCLEYECSCPSPLEKGWDEAYMARGGDVVIASGGTERGNLSVPAKELLYGGKIASCLAMTPAALDTSSDPA